MSQLPSSNPERLPTWYRTSKFLFTGFSAAFAMVGFGHPFDTMKVRLQSQSGNKKVYSSFRDVVVKTMKWEGIPGFYKGYRIPLAGQIVTRTALFTSFDLAKEIVLKTSNSKQTQLTIPQSLFCGMIAGICTGIVDTPIELCKSKLQTQIIHLKNNNLKDTRYNGVLHFYIDTLRKFGLPGVFHGFTAHVLRQTTGCTFYFTTYEYLRYKMINNFGANNANQQPEKSASMMIYISIIAGAISGIAYWVMCYNLDVIKSARMFEPIDKNKRKFANYYQLIKHLYQKEGGYRRFWAGFTPCILRSAPTNSAIFLAVECSKRYFPSYEQFTSFGLN